ncbi:MAG TPA: MFS transporter [Propionibacteriaceae bacterium]|nr:MFS transporter [Propionibacteriaceae bacterium]
MSDRAATDQSDHPIPVVEHHAAAVQGDTSALAPLKSGFWRWLWLGALVSSIGGWMQMVGAQWLFVKEPNAATIVSFIQMAQSLPMVLLAFPAGVLADIFDRRWLMFSVQIYVIGVAFSLAVLTFMDKVTAPMLIAFTFLIACAGAIQTPAWQSLIPEIVPREQVPAASRLEQVSVNAGRAAGPAIAGFVIAAWGVPWVFALNAASVLLLAGTLLAWRRPRIVVERRERFIPALRAGGRYVSHEPVVRRIILRLVMFIFPACAIWALLAIIASQRLGLEASGYGLLFAAMGTGAVMGALTLGKIRAYVSTNTLILGCGTLFAVSLALTVIVPNFWTALPVLVLAGFGWTATIATLNAELQLYLPVWVRARGIAIYLMSFMIAQSIGSPIWGQVAQHWGLRTAIFTAAGVSLLAVVGGLFWRIPETGHMDRAPLAFWGEAAVLTEPDPNDGPIVVTVEYVVPPESEAEYFAAMQDMRRSRRRSGATRWDLYRIGEQPDHFLETFEVPSWEEHQRQHSGRLTAQDKEIEDRAHAFSVERSVARHLLPPGF